MRLPVRRRMQACARDKAPGKDATRMLSNPISNTEKASESSFIWPQQRKTWNRERKGLRKRGTEEKYSKFVLLMKGPSIWSGWYIFTFWYIDLILSDFVINSFSSKDWKPQEEFTFIFNFVPTAWWIWKFCFLSLFDDLEVWGKYFQMGGSDPGFHWVPLSSSMSNISCSCWLLLLG